MEKRRSVSTVCPPEWDTVSSPDTVYHNTDVQRLPATAENPELYVYTQQRYSRQAYRTLEEAGHFALVTRLAENQVLIGEYEAALTEIEEALGVSV